MRVMGHYCGWELTPPMAAPDIRITGPRRTECSWHELGLGTEWPCPRLWRCQVRCQVSLSMSGITSHHRLRWETNLLWHNHLSIHTQWRFCLPLETWSWVSTLWSRNSRVIFSGKWMTTTHITIWKCMTIQFTTWFWQHTSACMYKILIT